MTNMEIYVYLDVLFVLNFVMDWAVMLLSALLLRKKVKKWRIAAGAALAAACYCAAFILGAKGPFSIIAGAAGLFGGAAIGFLPMRIKEYLMVTACVIGLTVALGGGCIAVYFMLFTPGSPGMYFIDSIPMQLILPALIGTYFIVKTIVNRVRRRSLARAEYKGIRIVLMDKEVSVVALGDTGHTLKEPISRWPVVIAELASIKGLLPEKLKLLFSDNGESDLTRVALDFEECGLSTRMRLIPYTTVGVKNGTLIGFRPDEAILEGCEHPIKELIIAIYNGSLSKEGEYQALMSPEIYHI